MKKEKTKSSLLSLEKYYKTIVFEDLLLKQNYKNIMEIPKLEKIVINNSSKYIVNDKKQIIPTLLSLELLSGQKATITKAKKSIATFKLRKNQIIGAKVTLRRFQKTAFFEKLTKVLLPRLNDYTGTNQYSFDKKGQLNLGIENILLFPELENYFQFFESTRGLNISIKISTKNQKESFLFFSLYQTPIILQTI